MSSPEKACEPPLGLFVGKDSHGNWCEKGFSHQREDAMKTLALPGAAALATGTIAFLAVARTAAALAPPGPPTTKAVRRCPVMPDEEIDESVFVDWHGTRVYFCCERCKSKFKRDPEKYAAAIASGSDKSTDIQRADEVE